MQRRTVPGSSCFLPSCPLDALPDIHQGREAGYEAIAPSSSPLGWCSSRVAGVLMITTSLLA
jgi:hypothetical protein